MSKDEKCQRQALPKEVCIPEDFEGVVQINIQSQKETETESVVQAQNQSTAVAVTQLQAQLQAVLTQVQQLNSMVQPISVQVQQAQSQQQACCAQTAAQLQALQSQLNLIFMAILGAPAGADAGQRQELLREIVAALRPGGK